MEGSSWCCCLGRHGDDDSDGDVPPRDLPDAKAGEVALGVPAPEVIPRWLAAPGAALTFTLNGKAQEVSNPDPEMLLIEYLRDVAGLTGTKLSCGEGGCGACTVVMERWSDEAKAFGPPLAINSCLRALCSMQDTRVTTIEGIGSKARGYHPIQERLAQANGTQCGFCSPGFVMNAFALEASAEPLTPAEVEQSFDGNLCRCTGYRPILDAMHAGLPLCEGGPAGGDIEDLGSCDPACAARGGHNGTACAHASTAGRDALPPAPANFPREGGAVCARVSAGPRVFSRSAGGKAVTWVAPATLSEAYDVIVALAKEPHQIVSGHTAIAGVQKYYDKSAWHHPKQRVGTFVDIGGLPDLRGLRMAPDGIEAGANVTLSELLSFLKQNRAKLPTHFDEIAMRVRSIATKQVRNAGTLGGNIALASAHQAFPSSLLTVLAGAGAQATVGDAATAREATLKIESIGSLQGKLLLRFFLPFAVCSAEGGRNPHFRSFKASMRHQNAHAIANAAFCLAVDPDRGCVNRAKLCFGGVRPGLARASKCEAFLVGQTVYSAQVFSQAASLLVAEVRPDEGDRLGEYKQSLVLDFFYKFFLSLQPSLDPRLLSAAQPFARPVSSGTWDFAKDEDEAEFPVSKPVRKVSGLSQTAGETTYVGDLPHRASGLHGYFVFSTVARCGSFSLDPTAALAMPGVVAVIDAQTLAEDGIGNWVSEYEGLFATGTQGVTHAGQRLALVVADSRRHASQAADAVAVGYREVEESPVVTMDQAVAAGRFYSDEPETFVVGDANEAMQQAAIKVTGRAWTGHQHHFHMEAHTARAEATSSGMCVTTSTQNPGATAAILANNLGCMRGEVEVQLTQAGGGFGGKLSRAVPTALAAAVAAKAIGRPVDVTLDLNGNLSSCGSRRPHLLEYQVACDERGWVAALAGKVYILQGSHNDLSGAYDLNVLKVAIDAAYDIPNWDLQGWVCKTDTPGNTWCRSPVFMPAAVMLEQVMDHVASAVKRPPEAVKRLNMYKQGGVTPLGQQLNQCTLEAAWEYLMARCDWAGRVEQVQQFNEENRFVKKGLAVTPIKYGLGGCKGYPAVVRVQEDASVLIQHSGCEVGQALNTKATQVAAYTLGIDMALVRCAQTSSRVTPNSASTGGSITSEGVCASVRLACEVIMERSAPVREKMPNGSWQDIVRGCYASGVDLLAAATYEGQREAGLPDGPGGEVFEYVTYGVAATQVRVDMLTGETHVERADLVQDVGTSLNPFVDCGQIQGAYVMGLGMMLSEEFVWDADGKVTGAKGLNVTNGTWDYKPPSTTDIPIEFNVSLLPNAPNRNGVLSSKAVAEPPMLLACGVATAIRKSIQAFRSQEAGGGACDHVSLEAPATVAVVQKAAGVTADMLRF